MASLKKRKNTYYIRFFKILNGKRQQKALSLGTKIKREAQKMLIEYEDQYERGEIDPFNGWTPKKEVQKKRQKLRGKYVALHKAADQFIEQRTQANAKSKKNYSRHLDMLMDKLGRTMPVTEIRESDIREFCFRGDLAVATKVSYLRHLKVFFRWMHERNILNENITDHIKPPATIPDKKAQRIINREQLGYIFEAFDQFYKEQKQKGHVSKPHQMRIWFKPMITTIFYTGLRASEAVNLKWTDVKFDSDPEDPEDFGNIIISNSDDNTTKAGNERIIPIRKPLKPVLVAWHKKQEEMYDGYVFPSSTGLNRFQGMTAGSLSRSFKKFVRLADRVPNTVHLHGLRGSCITDLLRRGVAIENVKKIAGHNDIKVTLGYADLDDNDVKNAVRGID